MTRAVALLLLALLVGSGLADAQATNATFPRERGGERGGFPWAQVAMLTMVAGLVLVPLNLWRRALLPRLLAAGAKGKEDLVRAGAWLRGSGVNLHMVFGAATLVAGTVHGLTERRSNWELWAGMAGILALLVLGVTLRWVPRLARHRAPALAAKWALTGLSLALLLYGHSLAHPAFGGRRGG